MTPSQIDRAVEALAPYLVDGWIAQDEDGDSHFFESEPWAEPLLWESADDEISLTLPKFGQWEDSLRRIQGGKVVPSTTSGGEE